MQSMYFPIIAHNLRYVGECVRCLGDTIAGTNCCELTRGKPAGSSGKSGVTNSRPSCSPGLLFEVPTFAGR